MPRFKIETNAQVKRTYFVTAETADAAEDLIEQGDQACSLEEELSEEIDETTEVSAEDIASEIAA